GEDWSSPSVYAQRHGAKGVLVILNAQGSQNWEQLRLRSTQPARAVVEKFTTQSPVGGIPSIVMSSKMATALLAGEKFDAATIVSRADGSDPVPAFDLSTAKAVAI